MTADAPALALPEFLVDENGHALEVECRAKGDLFTGGPSCDPPGRDVVRAKPLCQRCPVQQACLAYALDHGEEFGVWGGLTSRERRALLKHQREESTAA